MRHANPKKGAVIRAQVLQDKADRFAANVLPVPKTE